MTTKIETTENLNTLETQGHALGKAWKAIQRSDRKQITDFDLPLGKLMLALEAEASGGQIKKARLIACGINGIDRRRRNDAKHLAANWEELSPMVKRFTSTTALLAAWNKSKKADNADEPKADKPEQPKAEKASNVGQSEAKPKASMSASDIALEAMVQCEVNGIAIKDFMLALKEQLELLDETKVAA
jgi:hypothetical protein